MSADKKSKVKADVVNASECQLALREAFTVLVQKVNKNLCFSLDLAGDVFTVTLKKTKAKLITVTLKDIPCRLSAVPEILSLYIVAQLLKVAQKSAVDKCEENITDAGVYIKEKIEVLMKLGA